MQNIQSFLNCFTYESVLVFDSEGVLLWQNHNATKSNFEQNQQLSPQAWQNITADINVKGKWKGSLNLAANNSTVTKTGCVSFINIDNTPLFVLYLAPNQGLLNKEQKLLERLKLISENSTTVTTLYTVNGKAEYISPQALKVFGYTPEELMNQPTYHGIDIEFKKPYLNYVAETIKGKTREDGLELKYVKKDGSNIWIKIRLNPVFDSNGKVNYIQSATNEVTKRKDFEKKLRESERNANAIINSSDSAILLLTPDCKIITVNDRAKMLGTQLFKSAIKAGDDFMAATPRFYKETFKEFFDKALRGESGQSYRKLTFGKKRDFWFLFKYTPIWENDGTVSAVAWIATDVTDEKKTEEYTITVLERLSLANNAGEIGIWEHDFETGIMKFDDQCLILFDKKIDVKVSLAKWAKMFNVQSRSKILSFLGNKEISGIANFELEINLDQPIGSYEYYKLKGRITYKKGKAVSATGVLIDFTKSKLAEKNLEANRDQLLQAQQVAKMGDFEYDINKNKVSWSQNNYLIHGISSNQMPTLKQYLSNITVDDRLLFINALRKASRSNASQELIVHFGKHVFNYTIKGMFYRNKLVKIIGTIQDITDNFSLQKKLADKDNEINESKKRMSQYSFMNSHKVRAPLSNILGLIQLLKLEYNAELFEMLEKSADELDHVIHEVNSILAE
ncbi:MAG: PAS domain S-box protein [Bacteroidia bacterium]